MSSHISVRVRFAETDQMGIAHHGSYVAWFEMGRVEWLRERGLSYRTMEEQGVSLAVSALEISYRSPVRFDDEIEIETSLRQARSRRFTFAYRVTHRGGRVLVATASSTHTPIDRDRSAIRLPLKWAAVLTSDA